MQLFKTPHIKFLKYKYIALAVTGRHRAGRRPQHHRLQGPQARRRLRRRHAHPGHDSNGPRDEGQIRDLLGQTSAWARARSRSRASTGREFQIRAMEPSTPRPPRRTSSRPTRPWPTRSSPPSAATTARPRRPAASSTSTRIDEKSLTALLEGAFPGSGPDAARKVISYRNETGIIADFAELDGLGLKPEVQTFLKEKTYLGKMTVLSRETVGPQVGADLRRKAVQATIWSLLGHARLHRPALQARVRRRGHLHPVPGRPDHDEPSTRSPTARSTCPSSPAS